MRQQMMAEPAQETSRVARVVDESAELVGDRRIETPVERRRTIGKVAPGEARRQRGVEAGNQRARHARRPYQCLSPHALGQRWHFVCHVGRHQLERRRVDSGHAAEVDDGVIGRQK